MLAASVREASGVAATELTAQAAPISSIEPFLEQGSVLSDAPWGWIAGAFFMEFLDGTVIATA
ncbi:hypothetical protein, partial [Enterobacter sp. BH2-YP2023]|uniref:hypothetical protein n=1 Tax=Enterobacter sp. BH2-YP2023 TaxID=3402818 RepID=UPI003D721D37